MDKILSNKNYDSIFLSFYAFFCIFAPPIIPNINILLIVAFFSLINLFNSKKKAMLITKKSGINSFVKCYSFSCFYVVVLICLNILFSDQQFLFKNNYLITLYRLFLLVPAQLVCIIYFIKKCEQKNYSLNRIYLILIYAGLIECVFVFIAYFFPNIQQLLLNIMAENTGNEALLIEYRFVYRGFGFASTLLDTFGYGVGILITIALFLAFSNKIQYIIFAFLLIASTILNARTGILISVVGFVCIIPVAFKNKSLKEIMKYLILTIVIIGLVIVFTNYVINSNNPTLNWLKKGIESITYFFIGKDSQYYDVSNVLFSKKFWTFPEFPFFIFGTGHSAYGLSTMIGFHSDVGYVNSIWREGIIGLCLFIFTYMNMFIRAYKESKDTQIKYLIIFLVIAFLAMLTKGDMIAAYNPGNFLTLLICFSTIYNKKVNIVTL